MALDVKTHTQNPLRLNGSLGKTPVRRNIIEFFQSEYPIIVLISLFAIISAWLLPARMTQDGWLSLLGGREVIQHGLPNIDTLTYWTAGKHWIDQQWLAQVLSYGAFKTGGVRFFLFCNFALVISSIMLAVYVGRKLGAGTRAMVWMLPGVCYFIIFANARSQSLAFPLFILVLYFLIKDVRAPSRQVFLVIPLLILWANLHGSVTLGCALVALRAGLSLITRKNLRAVYLRAAALLIGSTLALLATPYGFSIIGYYHQTLGNPIFRHVIAEWEPLSPSFVFIPAYLIIAGTLWLLGRKWRFFTSFECLALLALISMSIFSARYILFLGFGLIPLLARPANSFLPSLDKNIPRRIEGLIGIGTAVFACIIIAVLIFHPVVGSPYSASTNAAVIKVIKQQPNAKIFADSRYADWLLFVHPKLRGNISYDVRFELLSHSQIESIVNFYTEQAPDWLAAAKGADLIIISPMNYPKLVKDILTAEPKAHLLFQNNDIAIIKQN